MGTRLVVVSSRGPVVDVRVSVHDLKTQVYRVIIGNDEKKKKFKRSDNGVKI